MGSRGVFGVPRSQMQGMLGLKSIKGNTKFPLRGRFGTRGNFPVHNSSQEGVLSFTLGKVKPATRLWISHVYDSASMNFTSEVDALCSVLTISPQGLEHSCEGTHKFRALDKQCNRIHLAGNLQDSSDVNLCLLLYSGNQLFLCKKPPEQQKKVFGCCEVWRKNH